MNISVTLSVNGTQVYPSAAIEIVAAPDGNANQAQPDGVTDVDPATPLVPMGSSVLAAGYGAEFEF